MYIYIYTYDKSDFRDQEPFLSGNCRRCDSAIIHFTLKPAVAARCEPPWHDRRLSRENTSANALQLATPEMCLSLFLSVPPLFLTVFCCFNRWMRFLPVLFITATLFGRTLRSEPLALPLVAFPGAAACGLRSLRSEPN